MVVDAAIEYAKSVKLVGDGKDIWVFDIDETTLSDLPYLARAHVRFGAAPYNDTNFNEWVAKGIAPPVPAALRLYYTVSPLGFKPVFLTTTKDKFKEIRLSNLNKDGYYNWEKLIFKGESGKGMSTVEFKSKKRTELVNEGYRIIGNTGDQWSDLVGENTGNRTFKVPNPMHYIG